MSGNGRQDTAAAKSAYRIGEVSRLTDTKPFVLRFWETEFPMLQPAKTPKGHRIYRLEDVETVRLIRRLLYDEGFTIAGARRHLRDAGGGAAEAAPAGSAEKETAPSVSRKVLLDLRDALRAFLTVLESE